MQNSKLFNVLKAFTKRNWRDFDRYVRSPYHNQSELIIAFWDIIYELYPKRAAIDSEVIFKKIAPKEKFSLTKMRLMMSDLLGLIEDYLAQEVWKKEDFRFHLDKINAYRQLRLSENFKYELQLLKKNQEKKTHRNNIYFQEINQILQEEYQFLAINQRIGELPLQSISDHLDIAFIAQKLKYACTALSHQNIYKTNYEIGLINPILEYVSEKNLFHIPAISLYYYCYKAITTGDELFFKNFKNSIFENARHFPDDELKDLYLLATNYCIKCYNDGDERFIQEGFELYKNGIEQEYLIQNGVLSRFTYRNIVTFGLIVNDYDWIAQFIENYRIKLEAIYRESMYSFNKARLEYAKQNYKAALLLLQKAEYKDVLLNLAAKTVLLKIYFELKEFDLLDAHLEAMRVFIRRKEFIAYHHDLYLNLIKFVKKMMELPTKKQSLQHLILINEIEQTKVLAERKWLLLCLIN